MYQRLEELEMTQSNNSLEVKEVQRRYKLIISQMKSEYKVSQEKYHAKLNEISESYQKEIMRMEEAYLNKIEGYKVNIEKMKKEHSVKYTRISESLKLTHKDEITRLTVMINVYKEKLTRREVESRNQLIEI